MLSGAPGVPVLGPSGASAHLRAVADALGASCILAPLDVDHRGVAERPCTPIHVGGAVEPRRWFPGWRENEEIAAGRRLRRGIEEARPSLVWERHSLYCDAGWRVHATHDVPWILEVNAPPALERARWDRGVDAVLAERWERAVIAAAPRVVAVSRWLAQWCESLGAREVRYVPNGVVARAGDRSGTRRAMGLEDRLVIGFVGSGRRWHGVERVHGLLEALPHAVAVVVGPVSVAHPRALNVGVVPEARVADLVSAMDVALAPTREDAPPWLCPLKLLHYRAQGTPVVATDVGDTRELLGPEDLLIARWEDAPDAVRSLAGRRHAPWVRPWTTVVAEAIAGAKAPGVACDGGSAGS